MSRKKTKKFDASISRWRYWSHEISSPKKCPKCSITLEEEFHTYMLLVKEGSEVASFMAGNDGGWFCPNCPVVVLDHDKFANMAMIGGETQSGLFMVAGIVNLEAIPEDKRHLPIGDEDNPIPLVEFLNDKEAINSKRSFHVRKGQQRKLLKSRKKKKR